MDTKECLGKILQRLARQTHPFCVFRVHVVNLDTKRGLSIPVMRQPMRGKYGSSLLVSMARTLGTPRYFKTPDGAFADNNSM